jgi:hypothetical protein
MPTDYNMWRKFLSQGWVRAKSGVRASILHFPSSLRRDWTLEQRVAEISSWSALVSDPRWCETKWPEVVAQAQFESWRDVQSNLRAIREYLTQVLEARDLARADLERERENGVGAANALAEQVALTAAVEAKATAAEADAASLREHLQATSVKLSQLEASVSWMQQTLTWRTRDRLLQTPLLGNALRRWRSRRRSSP